MDCLKLLSKSEEQMDTLARTVYVFSADIGMKFRIKNSYHEEWESSSCEGIKLPDSEEMKEVEKVRYTYLGKYVNPGYPRYRPVYIISFTSY